MGSGYRFVGNYHWVRRISLWPSDMEDRTSLSYGLLRVFDLAGSLPPSGYLSPDFLVSLWLSTSLFLNISLSLPFSLSRLSDLSLFRLSLCLSERRRRRKKK